jgi:hypothetical protein
MKTNTIDHFADTTGSSLTCSLSPVHASLTHFSACNELQYSS